MYTLSRVVIDAIDMGTYVEASQANGLRAQSEAFFGSEGEGFIYPGVKNKSEENI